MEIGKELAVCHARSTLNSAHCVDAQCSIALLFNFIYSHVFTLFKDVKYDLKRLKNRRLVCQLCNAAERRESIREYRRV